MSLNEKYTELENIIKDLKSVAIAFSGGVDSTFLAKVCKDVLGNNAIAITVSAPIHSKREIEEAKELTQKIGITHKTIEIDILDIDAFKNNPQDRCYLCKKEIFSLIKRIAKDYGIKYIVDGSNIDDLKDYRPGLKALEELEIKSPLREAGLTKEDIRALSKELDLSTWDKPAFACLATRFPYGEEISKEKLSAVALSETYLWSLGFRQFRVRHHGEVCRIEVAPEERIKFFNLNTMDNVSKKLKKYGFRYVTIDLEGYRTGSMNETILGKDNK